MLSSFSSLAASFFALQSYIIDQRHITLLVPSSVADASPTVTIGTGTITGTSTVLPSGSIVNQFLGIPYAVSPPDRFSKPSPVPSITSLTATKWQAPCMQQWSFPNMTVDGQKARNFSIAVFGGSPALQDSEDCLYLNIYVPTTNTQNRPVMFWIFGGGLKFGHAGQQLYDGSFLANNQDVVVVTINYRTNVFGFPNSRAIDFSSHNLGFFDQRMALDWVQQNIENFGGDPTKVTLFGQSAGAKSVDRIVLNPPEGDTLPFRAAILQSDTATYNGPRLNIHTAWETLALLTGCNDANHHRELTCVKKLDANVIQNLIEVNNLKFEVWLDHLTTLPTPVNRNQTVPIMVGTNGQESRVFTVDKNNLNAYVESTEAKQSPAYRKCVMGPYAVGNGVFWNDADALSQLATERDFQCPSAYTCANSTNSPATNQPIWRYYFNASFDSTNFDDALCDRGFKGVDMYAFHTSEIAYIFGTLPEGSTNAQWQLSNLMQKTWAQFAKDPGSGPGWNQSDSQVMILGQHGAFINYTLNPTVIDGRCGTWHSQYFTDGSNCPSDQYCPCDGL